MTLLSLVRVNTGSVNVQPGDVRMISTDSLATITTPNYILNGTNSPAQVIGLSPADEITALYNYNALTGLGTFGTFQAVLASGIYTLNAIVSPGDVLLPVVSGDVAIFNGTTGQIKDSTILATNIVSKNAVNTMAANSDIILDKGTGIEATNAVTINHQSGVITTSSLTTAGAATYVITLTNSFIATSSVVLVSLMGGSNNATFDISMKATAASGSSVITIYNNTSATALNGTLIIGFLVV